ncbi:unnamed protein product [Thlaspi arvense]|uniref:ZF-HD dimerization-type domain-containing protein n=1 Tax=Thlaspi arvense TaxID=13288 RepID=A0AAU9T4A3_THLAR|nr:unnamed protein product [Thlaspi arvense]
MDEMKSKKQEQCSRRKKATAICRKTGEHVHYPPKRRTKSTRPRHAPSQVHGSIFTRVIRYGECRKNQASRVGATAYDGCGEFVSATTEEGSMNCAACGCHRSFHREESFYDRVLEVLKISPSRFRQIFCCPYGNCRKGNEKKRVVDRLGGGDLAEKEAGRVKKRLKTKYTAEQTEKMRKYAEKLRWKVSPESREEVDEFCMGIGVNRRKFMVWMNNHKEKN